MQLTDTVELAVAGLGHAAFEVSTTDTCVLFTALFSVKLAPVPAATLLTSH